MGSLAGIRGNPAAFGGLLAGLRDKESRVRAAALRALGHTVREQRQEKAVIPALIDHIERERQYRLRVDALELLVQLTGQNMGFRVDDWKKWWNVRKDHFRFSDPDEGRTLVKPHDMSYFGIEIASRRIASSS